MAIVIPRCHSLLSLHPTLPTSHHPSIPLYRSLHAPASPSLRLQTKGTFQPHETSQTEHEMCQYLEWELTVDPVTVQGVRRHGQETTPPPTTNPFLPPPATLAPTPTYSLHPPASPSLRLRTKGTFQPHETSQTEHEMCQYLEWELNVDPVTFREFEDMVKKYLVHHYITPPIYLPLSFFAPTHLSLSQTPGLHVPTARNQPDGARDVSVSGVGTQCGSGDVQGVRRHGQETTPPPTTNPFLPPPATLAPTPTYSLHPPAKA
ncbi:uncharacterized protein F5891DRAFT_1192861 [Suillus fuscotomentosus]|uniref:Uncharacterized protein n=1 Tax=Suillus fuscotomentosus TaxID=1912939 RepID=A0AAD4HH92_9AGAM|nr:uncharacterized protein F5891DRAFT_1192861 [Suillus fuscotomentosus]KAG1896518.1 hypothetical protein F5891DRAFT_1192861 [Suillus fuscotomentosus]